MHTYTKYYTRENSLICLEIWEKHQGILLKEHLGSCVPRTIFSVKEGVADVIYDQNIEEIWSILILNACRNDSDFLHACMEDFSHNLTRLESLCARGTKNPR
jgi:hypothetical protein